MIDSSLADELAHRFGFVTAEIVHYHDVPIGPNVNQAYSPEPLNAR
jgi:hypothetical protein